MAKRYPRQHSRTRRPAPARAVALTLTLALALTLGGAACSDDWVTPPATVVVVGDSLVYQSGEALRAPLAARGWDAALDGRPGSGITGGFSIGSWPDRIEALVSERDPDAVVVVLGTNGCECSSLSSGIDSVMSRLRDVERVYWLNVREESPIPDDPPAVNAALDAAEARYGSLEVVDLDGHFEDRPELIADDDIHFNDAGEREFARLIAEQLPDATDE